MKLLKDVILVVFLLVIANGCGKIKVKADIPDTKHTLEASINIPYEEIAEFCDLRYGYKSEESELCFKEYREFLNISIKASGDLTGFCEARYTKARDVEECKDDLQGIL